MVRGSSKEEDRGLDISNEGLDEYRLEGVSKVWTCLTLSVELCGLPGDADFGS